MSDKLYKHTIKNENDVLIDIKTEIGIFDDNNTLQNGFRVTVKKPITFNVGDFIVFAKYVKEENKNLSNTTGIIGEVLNEYYNATTQHGPFHSAHEGYAVILEEFEELKEEVFKKSQERDIENMRKEAIQVAAMAIRFITDICDKKNE